MITVRPAQERGRTELGWLDSWHTFSFGGYHDPAHLSFHALRVINDDVFAPGAGFGMHPHRDMEIVTVVLAGAIEHRDSLGNGGIVTRGEIQRMTAGTGILHSEFNPSETEPVHLLQIWILPETKGLAPSYEQRQLGWAEVKNDLRLIASRDGRDGTVTVHQDVDLLVGALDDGRTLTYAIKPGRHVWIQLTRGEVLLGGKTLGSGDGAAVSQASSLEIAGKEASEFLMFDLA